MDKRQLPFLIKLLNDETPEVQEQVIKALCAFGYGLTDEIKRQSIEVDDERCDLLREVSARRRRSRLFERWKTCLSLIDDKEKLEGAFCLLAEYELSEDTAGTLTILLDQFASGYQEKHGNADVFTLAHYLFRTSGLSGCDQNEYYNPAASNLVSVIRRGRGLPISLACIYLLVGKRLGLDIEGCNVPNHFLARAIAGDRLILVDCFNGGATLDVAQLIPKGYDAAEQIAGIRRGASVATILQRVLSNLSQAHSYEKNDSEATFFIELRESTG